MVYRNKLVAAIKVAGKILRETGDTVTLPFGAEYSILLKNLDSRRVQVKVSVDGKDATEGTWLVISPNSNLELERFIRNGNFDRGNRFKFIERTGEIEGHRGIGAEDGLIRVEYKRELVVHEEETIIRRHVVDEYEPWSPYPPCPWPRPRPWYPRYGGTPTRSLRTPSQSMRRGPMPTSTPRPTAASSARTVPGMDLARRETERGPVNDCAFDPGITVPGSESNQKFINAQWFATEAQSEVIVLKLRGKIGEIPVEAPVTVDHKPQCSTCGKSNIATATFCSACGIALQLI